MRVLLRTLAVTHRLEHLDVEDDEAIELVGDKAHPELVSTGQLHRLASYSGMMVQPGRAWNFHMNVSWIMRFIQAPLSPISI